MEGWGKVRDMALRIMHYIESHLIDSRRLNSSAQTRAKIERARFSFLSSATSSLPLSPRYRLPQHFYYDDTQQFPMTRDGCNMQLQSAARTSKRARRKANVRGSEMHSRGRRGRRAAPPLRRPRSPRRSTVRAFVHFATSRADDFNYRDVSR